MKNWSLVAALIAVLLAGCSSNAKKPDDTQKDDPDRPNVFRDRDNTDPLAKARRERRDARLDAEQLYRRARAALDASDYTTAVDNYDDLSKRFPFSDFATQGELERIYALYRSFESDRALSGADRFLREHPRHSAVDYVQYLKGLINFDRDSGFQVLPVDETKSDITSQRRAFDDFAVLLQKYPKSRYAGDAYQRMVFVRARLAAHELHVVDFYLRRGAYVAAAKRAEQIIAQYPGTPGSYRALGMLATCYEEAGLKMQAEDARRLLAGQDPQLVARMLSGEAPRRPAVAGTEAAPPAAQADGEQRGLGARIAAFFTPGSEEREGVQIVLPGSEDKIKSETGAVSEKDPAAATAGGDPASSASRVEVFYEPYEEAAPKPAPPATATP